MTPSNIINKVPYLRTSRNFPQDPEELSTQLSKTYIDIANFVNARTIGTFATNATTITGESWYVVGNERQQGLRQFYTFTSAGNIPHGINIGQIYGFTKIYGTYSHVTGGGVVTWYPLPLVDTVNVTNQVSVTVDATNIIITVGATAPTITSGFVVLEWIANV